MTGCLMLGKVDRDELLFYITNAKEDVQYEVMEKIGRHLTDDGHRHKTILDEIIKQK